jgi:very-short-patch-repair endonuclease
MSKKLTTNEFIKKAKKIHGNKYDYSLVNYNGYYEKVKIKCDKICHVIFEQTPKKHLYGTGCPICKRKSMSTQEFIKKAKKIHGNKYNYSLVKYKNTKTKIKINCKKHNSFEQLPNLHLTYGCIKCKYEKHFIENAKEIHNNKYNYSLVKYEHGKLKIKIICKLHGIFNQSPNHHLRGKGCPICKSSKGELEISKYLKKMNIKFKPQFKFDNCRNILPLSFDFYLHEKNICIEFDGLQHFKPIEYFGGIETFKLTQLRDKIKNKYCKDNNIKLLRIKYDEIIIKKLNTLNS